MSFMEISFVLIFLLLVISLLGLLYGGEADESWCMNVKSGADIDCQELIWDAKKFIAFDILNVFLR